MKMPRAVFHEFFKGQRAEKRQKGQEPGITQGNTDLDQMG